MGKLKRNLLLSFVALWTLVFLITGCNKEPEEGIEDIFNEDVQDNVEEEVTKKPFAGEKLTFMTYTEAYNTVVEDFANRHEVEVEIIYEDYENYMSALNDRLERGGDVVPDVYMVDSVDLPDLLETDYLADIGAMGADSFSDDYMDIIFIQGIDQEGRLKALSSILTIDQVYYRRSIAKEVFGSDETELISEMMASYDGLLDMAVSLYDYGYKLFPGVQSAYHFINPINESWVNSENQLVVSEERIAFYDFAKTLHDMPYTAQAPEWTDMWYYGMTGEIHVIGEPDRTEIFAYPLPSWGLTYLLKEVSRDMKTAYFPLEGDWAIGEGPSVSIWRNPYMVLSSSSSKTELGYIFLSTMCHDEQALREMFIESKQPTALFAIMDDPEYIENGVDSFIGDQNYITVTLNMAEQLNGANYTIYDSGLDQLFIESVESYIQGDMILEDAILAFKENVQGNYPSIEVIY